MSALAFDRNLNALYVAGVFTTYKGVAANRILRLAADGSVDTAFAIGTGLNNTVSSMVITSDGNLVAGGTFTTYKGASASRIVKLLASSGSIDTTFVTGTGFNNTVNVVTGDPISGAVYVGGNFTSYNGTTQNRIIKLSSGGVRDATFAVGAGANNQIYTLTFDTNANALLAGGLFTTYAGAASERMVRITSAGAKDTGYSVTTGADNTVRASILDGMGRNYLGGDFQTWKQSATGCFVGVSGAAALQ